MRDAKASPPQKKASAESNASQRSVQCFAQLRSPDRLSSLPPRGHPERSGGGKAGGAKSKDPVAYVRPTLRMRLPPLQRFSADERAAKVARVLRKLPVRLGHLGNLSPLPHR